MKYLAILTTLFIALSSWSAEYNLNNQKSYIGFEIIKFRISAPVEGKFKKFTGTATYDPKTKLLNNVLAKVEVKSVDTKMPKRDAHLQKDDFFSAKKYPKIIFKSKGVTKVKTTFKLTGMFTIRDKTKEITLQMVTKRDDSNTLILEGSTTINRLDYGVSWNSALEKSQWAKVFGKLGKFVLDDEVKIKLNIVAHPKS